MHNSDSKRLRTFEARVGHIDEWHVDLRKSAVQNGIGKMASLA
jgi:hypothetical protein